MCKAQNCDPIDREAVVDRRFRERLTRALDQCSDVQKVRGCFRSSCGFSKDHFPSRRATASQNPILLEMGIARAWQEWLQAERTGDVVGLKAQG